MSFDVLAPHYRWMERVLAGDKLQRCRTAQLDSLPASPREVLICGEGNGRFLEAFCRRFPETSVTCVDASAKMLQLAERRMRSRSIPSEIRFVHADILEWTAPTTEFDLIVTHFFLDCFRADQLGRIVPMLASAARPCAYWLLADFKTADRGLSRFRSEWILRVMYLFFQHVTRLPARKLTAPDPFLVEQGFRLVTRREMEWGLLHSDCWHRGESDAPRICSGDQASRSATCGS